MIFGKETETIQLTDDSTVSIERNYVNGSVNKPIRKYYEHRVRVSNKKDEMTEIIKFSDSIEEDARKIDPFLRWEYPKNDKHAGYYFLIKCYTVLDYADQPVD